MSLDSIIKTIPLSTLRRLVAVLTSVALLGAVLWIVEPTEALLSLRDFPLLTVSEFLGILFANLFVVAFRFWRVLAHLGIDVPWSVALRASMAGNVAGLFFIPLIGQVAGRQALLAKSGIPPAVNAGVAAFERILLAVISGSLAAWGVLFLLGRESLTRFLEGVPVDQVAVAISSGLLISYTLGKGRFEDHLKRAIFSWKSLTQIVEVGCITLLGQLLMLSCFVLGFHAIAPHLDMIQLMAASAVVSFAASLPLSAGGWGVREIAAVQVLSWIGIPAADAMVVSVMVGICSTLVLLGAVPFIQRLSSRPAPTICRPVVTAIPFISLEKSAVWLLSMATAVAMFFQVHTALPGGVINLNLADPFALLALVTLILQSFHHHEPPQWRIKWFNVCLLGISVVLVIGFFHGRTFIGTTQWAFGGRLLGWLVLLGNLSAGALLIQFHGRHGLRRMAETMLAVACVIIVQNTALRICWVYDLLPAHFSLTRYFQGYSANPNAFAFQLLCVVSLLLAYAIVYEKIPRLPGFLSNWKELAIGLILAAMMLIGSRAGLGVIAVLFMAAWHGKYASRKLLVRSCAYGVLLWGAILCISHVPYFLGWKASSLDPHAPSASFIDMMRLDEIQTPSFDVERWKSYRIAVDMWLQSPILGSGLGVFVERSPQLFPIPVVIHSTPLWILTELGLVGFAVYAVTFFVLARHALRGRNGLPRDRAFALVLLTFSLFCQVHEILYQRIFWLFLGALLAKPFSTHARKSES